MSLLSAAVKESSRAVRSYVELFARHEHLYPVSERPIDANQSKSLPFDDRSAEAYGEIRAELDRPGAPVGPNDLMIAAIAVATDSTLVTHNSREFGRISNLKHEDWE